MDDGVVVAALEVIPSRFCLVLVPAMPKTECFATAVELFCERVKYALAVQQRELFNPPAPSIFVLQEAGCPASQICFAA